LINIVFLLAAIAAVASVAIKKDGGLIKLVAGAAGLLGIVAGVICFIEIGSVGCQSYSYSNSAITLSIGTGIYKLAAAIIAVTGVALLAVAAGAHMKKVGGDAQTA